jgi:hypothetical protein
MTIAERLPDVLGSVVVDVARYAFVQGMQLTAGIEEPGRERETRLSGLSPVADG